MTVGIQVGSIVDEIGASSFLNAFFSTISGLLENGEAGTRFPVISRDLYEGHVSTSAVADGLIELHKIRKELSRFPPSSVIWDSDNLARRPPWGNNISPHITSMANYFVSSTGRDLIDLLVEAFDAAKQKSAPIDVVEI